MEHGDGYWWCELMEIEKKVREHVNEALLRLERISC